MILVVIVVFIFAFGLVWLGLWYLLNNPEIGFKLEGEVFAHEPNLDDNLTKIRLYLHSEEYASLSEICHLLNVEELEAEAYLDVLIDYGKVITEITEDGLIYKPR